MLTNQTLDQEIIQEVSMSTPELQIIREKENIIKSKDDIIQVKDEDLRKKDELIAQLTRQLSELRDSFNTVLKEKDEFLRVMEDERKRLDASVATQTATIAELTKTIAENSTMEKTLTTQLNTVQAKLVGLETQITETGKKVGLIRDAQKARRAITVWDPSKYQIEDRIIISLVTTDKSCFSDEITQGVWKLSMKSTKIDSHAIGVIDSTKLEQMKTGSMRERKGPFVFWLNMGSVITDGKETAKGNKIPNVNAVVTLLLDMNKHTLVLIVDGQKQPHSFSNLPNKVRSTSDGILMKTSIQDERSVVENDFKPNFGLIDSGESQQHRSTTEMLVPVFLTFIWSSCQPNDLNILDKSITVSTNHCEQLNEMNLEGSVIIIDSTNGDDQTNCWLPENANGCQTIKYALEHLETQFEGEMHLKWDENFESVEMEEGDLTIGERQLEVVGDGKDKVNIVDKSTSVLFSITTGSLALSSVSLVPSTTSTIVEVSGKGSFELSDAILDGADQTDAVFTKPFFFAGEGALTFDSVKISSFVFQNAAPIHIVTNTGSIDLTLQSSNFTSITRTEGSGVVVEAFLMILSTITIDDCQFIDCHSLDEDFEGHDITDPLIQEPHATMRGGVVRIDGDENRPGTVEITNCRFERNSQAHGAGAGVYILDVTTATITSCHFEDLTVHGIGVKGAAMSLREISDAKVTSCTFARCRITPELYGGYAGGLSVIECKITAKDCLFTDCSSDHMIDVVFLENITTGSSVADFVIRDCHDKIGRGLFFVWSSDGLTLSNISFLDCGKYYAHWNALSFGASTRNVVSVDGLVCASEDTTYWQYGQIMMEPNWYSDSSQLSFSNCRFICNEPIFPDYLFEDTKKFLPGFFHQIQVATEAGLPTATDETMCANPSHPCQTIAYALKLCPLILVQSEYTQISVGEGEHEEDPLVIEKKKIKLTSTDVSKLALLKTKDSTGSLLTVKQNSILIVESFSIVLTLVDSGKATISSSGTLTLTSVTFVNPSSSPTISGHLVEIAEGSATISKCVFPACSLSQGTSVIQIQSGIHVDLKEQEVDLAHSELGTFINIVGTASIESSSFSNITSISSFITGSGSLTVLDSTFLSIKEKDSSSSSSHAIDIPVGDGQVLSIGAESKPVVFTSCSSRGEGGALHCTLSGDGILSISHTTFTDCSSLKDGGACFVDLSAITTGSFTTGDSVSFTNCQAKGTHIDGIFIVCSDISALILPLTESTLLAAVKPPFTANSVFTAEERGRLRGRETKEEGTEGPLLFYWHPYASGPIHLSSGGEDHVLCGLTELPCSSLSCALSNVKPQSPDTDTPEVVIDSTFYLTSPLLSTATKWILSGSTSNSFTFNTDGQISIQNGVSSSLTLDSLSIVFGTDSASRTTPILDVEKHRNAKFIASARVDHFWIVLNRHRGRDRYYCSSTPNILKPTTF
ncbi:hypothetical protein BLNAU_9128 [Blattamonas nauphoetae]|uniref:Right handed beta helix domain-containing protein n=1 Tax=Blattamonas nauphoetae TaxID=2049346 RepID=A0ABQ9XWW1_9EUKA|nr:hypothetical protein BLNAU_9128 [Blattamonas nauphoetae]